MKSRKWKSRLFVTASFSSLSSCSPPSSCLPNSIALHQFPSSKSKFQYSSYSYRNASTGCSRAARMAGSTLASTAISIAPNTIQLTVNQLIIVGISLK